MKGRVRRGTGHLRRRPDVHAHHRLGLLAGPEEGVPVAGVHGGQPQRVGVLGEGHGEAALGGAALDLLHGEVHVPERDDGERDEAPVGVARAPLVDDPVVVGLHTEQRELLVWLLHEGLAAEARQGVGEADGHVHVVRVHVGQALLLLPAARADVVEGGDAEGQVAQPHRRREPREGRHQAVVVPDVPPLALPVGRPLQALGPAEAAALALDARPVLQVLAGQPALPEVRRLDHVVVHGDDAGNRHVHPPGEDDTLHRGCPPGRRATRTRLRCAR